MREIKFRAWDKERKTMLSPDDLCHLEGNVSKALKESSPHLELMQFTGLKDKNNREIYEGDIVKLDNSQFLYDDNAPEFTGF